MRSTNVQVVSFQSFAFELIREMWYFSTDTIRSFNQHRKSQKHWPTIIVIGLLKNFDIGGHFLSNLTEYHNLNIKK